MIDRKTSATDNIKNTKESWDNGEDNYQYTSFQLTNNQLREAIIYSEILGKPKCKTRRRR